MHTYICIMCIHTHAHMHTLIHKNTFIRIIPYIYTTNKLIYFIYTAFKISKKMSFVVSHNCGPGTLESDSGR